MKTEVKLSNGEVFDTQEIFEIQGSNKIAISKSNNYKCGTAEGFSFDTEDKDGRFTGGVMDKVEAKRMADYIYANL